jgi:hypothetical protein
MILLWKTLVFDEGTESADEWKYIIIGRIFESEIIFNSSFVEDFRK